jgi:hypothetical protein
MVVRRSFKAPDEAAPEMPEGAPTEPADASGETGSHDAASPEAAPRETPQDSPGEAASEVSGAVPAHVANVPESALERAEAMVAETAARMEDLVAQRRELLLVGSDDQIAEVDAKIAVAERLLRTRSDRVAALREQAEREAAEQRAADREAKIVEIERTLIERDAAAADLQKYLCKAEAAFRRVFELGLAARTAWVWPHGRLGGVLSSGSDLRVATQSYLYKIGTRPARLGGEYPTDVPPAFPGGKCPKLEMLQQPDKLPDLADEYRAASRYASDTMRGVAPEPVPAHRPVRTDDNVIPSDQSPARPAVGITGGQSNVPTITPEMAEIIRRQMQLAMKDDPASAEEYFRNGELLKELSA